MCVLTQAWASVVNSLGSTSGMQTFLDTVTNEYVRVTNEVLQANPSKSPVELKEHIDSEQYKVDLTTPKMFVDCWNDVATSPAFEITEADARIDGISMYKWKYFWCLGPLLQACRQTFAATVRKTFDVKMPAKPYVPDRVCHPPSPCCVCGCACMCGFGNVWLRVFMHVTMYSNRRTIVTRTTLPVSFGVVFSSTTNGPGTYESRIPSRLCSSRLRKLRLCSCPARR